MANPIDPGSATFEGGMRPRVGDLDSMRAGIGAALRVLHSEVLRETLWDRFAELLRLIGHPHQFDEASSGSDSACRQVTPEDPRAFPVAARLFCAPKEMAERRPALPPETKGYHMVQIRQFNADAAVHFGPGCGCNLSQLTA
jgi:hypothetical protein